MKKLKDKDKLLHTPKSVPETAKDVYGEVSVTKLVKKGDEKKESAPELPGDGEQKPAEFPDLGVNARITDVDKSGVAPQAPPQQTQAQRQQPPLPAPLPDPGSKSIVTEPPQIATGAEAPASAPEPTSEPVAEPKAETSPKVEASAANSPPIYRGDGFFNDFERFFNNRNLDDNFLSELLGKDLLDKMKQFHLKREEGMPFIYNRDNKELDLVRKMEELEKLEEEWYIRHRNAKDAEILLLEKEAEIDMRLEELKGIMRHLKQSKLFQQKADKNHYFTLGDGRILTSIADLRETLKTMSDELYNYHATDSGNHFADWVRHVFHDDELADRMVSALSRKELLEVLYDY